MKHRKDAPMTPGRKFAIGTLVLVAPLIVAGAISDAHQPPPQAAHHRVMGPSSTWRPGQYEPGWDPGSGGNFLPLYLQQLQGRGQPPNDACHPLTLADMLTPCDRPGKAVTP